MLTLLQLLALEGPNTHSPQPGVFLTIHSKTDQRRVLRDALKDAAQQVGLVISGLELSATEVQGFWQIEVFFNTPGPDLGAAIAAFVIDRLNAEAQGNEEWDADEALWLLQKRRRAEALPLAALQLLAEASLRGLPAFRHSDGRLQLGQGVRGVQVSVEEANLPVAWEQIGRIPLVAISGGEEREPLAAQVIAVLQSRGYSAGLAQNADLAATRALLANPHLTHAIVSLEPAAIAQHGLGFDQCSISIVIGMPATLLPSIADRSERVRLLGLPVLVTQPEGFIALDSDFPELAELADYAPGPIVPFSGSGQPERERLLQRIIDWLQ